jgi:hypothetical protein
MRTFFRDVLGFAGVDVGGGWLIFALPPAELAFHPTRGRSSHELYLMCDDVKATAQQLAAKGVKTDSITDQGWGLLTHIRLPDGSSLGLYEPNHPRPRHSNARGRKHAPRKRQRATR